MGIPSVFQTARSGMIAAKAQIATTGHNVANANTEGYSRQRVQQEAGPAHPAAGSHAYVGSGTLISRVERMNDSYLNKQIRNSMRDISHMEEKGLVLKQTEDVFNEMGGEGLNRLMSRFFNEFRKLSNDPDSEAVRQSVRESAQAMVNDFHRIRQEVEDVRKHIDARIEGHVSEVNSLADQLKDLNIKIKSITMGGGLPNDLEDQRDMVLKKLSQYLDLNCHQDNEGNYMVDIVGVGPLVAGPAVQHFSVERSPADDRGKPEGAFDVKTTASAHGIVTHSVRGGKIGALLEARDKTLSTILDRLDGLAYTLSDTVNAIHEQGFTRGGAQGVGFFKALPQRDRAAEFLELSDQVKASTNNIATAAIPDAPGDNRVALAISSLQTHRLMNDGKSTMDDWYNSMVSDVGVAVAKNREGMNQQKDIMTQLNKMHDQISGVSIDEEAANLMQFQHAFDASARVIQVADEMLKTVLELRGR